MSLLKKGQHVNREEDKSYHWSYSSLPHPIHNVSHSQGGGSSGMSSKECRGIWRWSMWSTSIELQYNFGHFIKELILQIVILW